MAIDNLLWHALFCCFSIRIGDNNLEKNKTERKKRQDLRMLKKKKNSYPLRHIVSAPLMKA